MRKIYYSLIFPSDLLFSDKHDKALYRRGMDVAFVYDNNIWDRRYSGQSAEFIKAQIAAQNPKEIHFGAAWHHRDASKTFAWRPFVIDIDLPDYELSSGGKLPYRRFKTLSTASANPCDPTFRKSWTYIVVAVKIIDYSLEHEYGFKDRRWVFSGNKGVHCWVMDARACVLTDMMRRAIFESLTSDQGLFRDDIDDPKIASNYKEKIFRTVPFLQSCYTVIRKYMPRLLDDQDLWHDAKAQVCPGDSWAELEKHNYIGAVEFALKVGLPRLDLHAAQCGHMSKIPFSVHGKTGKIAVPFSARHVDDFDPQQSPTVEDVVLAHDGGVPSQSMQAFRAIFGSNT